jgi:dTMP kinase
MRGFLLVLEGIDGSGKSTLARGLAKIFESRGREVVMTREPTDGPFGKKIRALAATGRDAVSAEEEFQLFHQDRIAHVRELVRPSIARGAIVIQDRSYFSSVAYQGERGLDRDRLLRESESIAPKPDALVVVDVPASVAVTRIKSSRGGGQDDFEAEQALDRIRQVFLGFSGAQVVDGQAPPDQVLAATLAVVDPILARG